MRLYFDFEFTGLHQITTPVSLGIVDQNGRAFYAEFTDYDRSQVDTWVHLNVISHLIGPDSESARGLDVWGRTDRLTTIGTRAEVRQMLLDFLASYGPDMQFEMWGDCLAYDWVLFCDLFGGALALPRQIYYTPFDIATLFKSSGRDPDVSRAKFSRLSGGQAHFALTDAYQIKACHERILQEHTPNRPPSDVISEILARLHYFLDREGLPESCRKKLEQGSDWLRGMR